MVKLGDAYVDLNAVDAIVPMRGVMGGYSVYLTSGRFFDLPGLTEGEVEPVLETAGLLEPDVEETGRLMLRDKDFSGEELAELLKANARGFLYVAKDSGGQVYAYSEEPTKGQNSWINDDSVSHTLRMKAGNYDILSFEDALPVFIPAIFGEAAT